MSDFKITTEKKKKFSVMISETNLESMELIREYIGFLSNKEKVTDSEVFDVAIKVAAKSSEIKKYKKKKESENSTN
jgi:hypothetical protein